MAAAAPGLDRRLPRAWGAAIFATAAALRLLALFIDGRSLAFLKYPRGAELLLAGRLHGAQVLDFSPLYLDLHALAALAGVTNGDFLRAAQCLLGAASCVLIAAIATRLAGRATGLAAGLIAAFARSLVTFDQVLEPEAVLVFLTALAVWLVVTAAPADARGRRWRWLGAGASTAMAMAARPSAALLAVVLVPSIAAMLPRPRLRPALRAIALFAAGLAVVQAAWSARAAYWGEGAVMSPGSVTFTGNNPDATGLWRDDFLVKDIEFQDPDPAVPDYAHDVFRHVAVAAGADPADPDRYWISLVARFALRHPARWLELVGFKALALGQPFEPHDLESSLELRQRLRPWPLVDRSWIVALGFAGLVVFARRLWLAGLVMLAQAAVCLVFYVSARHLLALVPWAGMGAAMVLVEAGRAVASRAGPFVSRHLARPGVIAVATPFPWTAVAVAAGLAVLFRLPMPPWHDVSQLDAEARATHPVYAEAARLRDADRFTDAASRLESCVLEAPWFADLFALAEVPLPIRAIGERHAAAAVDEARSDASPRSWLRAAMLLDFAGRRDAALDAYAMAGDAVVWPGDEPVAYQAAVRRGVLLLGMGRRADARSAFQDASGMEPGAPEALVGLALASGGDDAAAALDDACAGNPEPYVLYLRGRMALDARMPGEALVPLKALVRMLPRWPRARLLLGFALARTGDVAAGASEVARAQAQFPPLFDPFYVPVGIMRAAAERAPPGQAMPWERLATFAAVYGDVDGAVDAWHRLESIRPLKADELARVGWLLLRHGRPTDAVPYFRRALAADPRNARARQGLLRVPQTGRDAPSPGGRTPPGD